MISDLWHGLTHSHRFLGKEEVGEMLCRRRVWFKLDVHVMADGERFAFEDITPGQLRRLVICPTAADLRYEAAMLRASLAA